MSKNMPGRSMLGKNKDEGLICFSILIVSQFSAGGVSKKHMPKRITRNKSRELAARTTGASRP
jgi:hypothetical protein